MKKIIPLVFLTVLLLIGCTDSYEQSGESLVYDKLRGDKSSVVNIVQYESLSQCLDQYNFDFLAGKTIRYEISAANEQVYDQLTVLLNKKIILSIEKE